MERKILHCDMNSFYASVELLSHPEYVEKPVAVAGDPEQRHGIILAKNQIAKTYGIVTAETIQSAKKKCPNLIILSPHHELYEEYFYRLNSIYLEYTDLVEPFSIDESWLDVTGSERLFGDAVTIANTIRARIKKELGLTLSVGVSYNKIFAKMGSEYKKPDATTVIDKTNFKEILWPQDVSNFFFVGKSTSAKLKGLGIITVGDLASTEESLLTHLLGKLGSTLYRYTNGLDDSPVKRFDEREAAKSLGHGITFKRNLQGFDDISLAVTEISTRVSERLRRNKMKAYGIKVEITDPSFIKVSRQQKSTSSINTAAEIKKIALKLIDNLGYSDSPIRLLTITGINLKEESAVEQLTFGNLLNNDSSRPSNDTNIRDNNGRDENLELMLDEIKKKYGEDSIKYAHSIDNDLIDR